MHRWFPAFVIVAALLAGAILYGFIHHGGMMHTGNVPARSSTP